MWQQFKKILRKTFADRHCLNRPQVLPVRPWILPFNAPKDETEWQTHWREKGQTWRTEPEITGERQDELVASLSVPHNAYPFNGMVLTRGDVEWLLATHHGGLGPVNWDDTQDQRREGLDLRGAILRGENLKELPLTGLFAREGDFEDTILTSASLEAADFVGANLRRANLSLTRAEQANFSGARLERATLVSAEMKGASFKSARLTGANLLMADLTQAHRLAHTDFTYARLEAAELSGAHMELANLGLAHLEHADLRGTHLEGANLRGACLAGVRLSNAHLESADLSSSHLEGRMVSPEELNRIREWVPDFPEALSPADLRLAFLDKATILNDAQLGDAQFGYPRVADVRWEGANLAVVDWASVVVLGDELAARQDERDDRELRATIRAGRLKLLRANLLALRPIQGKRYRRVSRAVRHYMRALFQAFSERQRMGYQEAVRANRQMSTALRAQGLNEDGNRFAYRSQVLHQQVLRRQGAFVRLMVSWVSDMLAGYGYKLRRSAYWYFGVIVVAAVAYYWLGMTEGFTLDWARVIDSVAESVTAFHGRGIFSENFSSGDPRSLIAAAQAVFGLIIEICLIVTFTQRFFEK